MVEGLQFGVLLEQHVALDPPRDPCAEVVGSMATGWDSEDVVELLKSTLLRFGKAEQDNNERNDVETRVKSEGSSRGESYNMKQSAKTIPRDEASLDWILTAKHDRESETKNGANGVVPRNAKRHSNLSV
jgi:hypothetical protein